MAEIVVVFKHNNDNALLHRIGNFYEDVYVAFRDSAEASVVSDIDALTQPLKLHVRGRRKVSRVAKQIEQILSKQKLREFAALTTT